MPNFLRPYIFLFVTVFTLLVVIVGCGSAFSSSTTPDGAGVEVPPEPTNTPPPIVEPLDVSDPCSYAGQQAQVDTAFAAYQAQRSAENDPVLDLRDWVNDVSAEIAVSCNPFPATTTDPATLAALLQKLQTGGYIIYVRHPHTDRTRSDDDTSLGMCDQQRILSERGREESLLIRNAYQRLNLPVSLLISTQYCRTLETAVLAFGVPQVVQRRELFDGITDFLSIVPEAGTNTIIVAHIGTLRNTIGLDDTFDEGDSFVYQPLGNGEFEFIGRIGLYDWPTLADMAKTR